VRNSDQVARISLEKKDRRLTELQAGLARRVAGTETSSVKPENIVWIFGVGRSGSS
jgi:hypothetical protein